MRTRGLLSFICLIALVHSSSSLKCWECDSEKNPKCTDPFDSSVANFQDCNELPLTFGNIRVCLRQVEQKDGKMRTKRKCHQKPGVTETADHYETGCEAQSNSNGDSSTNCWCRGLDGCNAFRDDSSTVQPKPNSGDYRISPFLTLITITVFFTTILTRA